MSTNMLTRISKAERSIAQRIYGRQRKQIKIDNRLDTMSDIINNSIRMIRIDKGNMSLESVHRILVL